MGSGKVTQGEMWPQETYEGPMTLEMAWELTDGCQTLITTWRMRDGGNGAVVRSGECSMPVARSWEFGEAAVLVHRLRELRSISRPF